MLNKCNRISDRKQIQQLFDKGKLYKSYYFIFKYLPCSSPAKFSIAISKKIAKRAVDRNRLRRQISEAIRLNLDRLTENFIVLVIARPPSQNVKYNNIHETVLQFFNLLSKYNEK